MENIQTKTIILLLFIYFLDIHMLQLIHNFWECYPIHQHIYLSVGKN